jgi:hypothetical protein
MEIIKMANSKRRCTKCKTYEPIQNGVTTPLGFFCSHLCKLNYVIDSGNKLRIKAVSDKITRAQTKTKKESLKTVSNYKNELQVIFNKWVRIRDRNNPCESCQRHHTGQYHAGHYRSRGSCPELRYEPDNCFKQCAPCNNHLSGNLINFRINLIKKLGIKRVEWIEGPHEPKKYTIEQLKELKTVYKAKIKQLEQDIAA